jgi:hypothetical protein
MPRVTMTLAALDHLGISSSRFYAYLLCSIAVKPNARRLSGGGGTTIDWRLGLRIPNPRCPPVCCCRLFGTDPDRVGFPTVPPRWSPLLWGAVSAE